MITKETHSIDWNKTAHVAGVVLVALAKAAWWLAKHGWAIIVAALAVLAKVFVAFVSVAGSSAYDSGNNDQREIQSCDDNGCDLNTGLPIKNRF